MLCKYCVYIFAWTRHSWVCLIDWVRFPLVTSWWVRWRLNHRSLGGLLNRFVQAQINENIKAPHHWPLWVEFTGDRWIPLTKGQWRGKCFTFMTSPCMRSVGIFHQIYARLRFASFRSGYLTLLKDRNELFAHAVQGCVSGSGTTVWSPQCQGNNPEGYR